MSPPHEDGALRMAAARAQAGELMPYLSTALFAITPIPSDQVPTMAIDRRWRLYWNPAWCRELPVTELAGGWLHEVGHLLREHADRFAALLEPSIRAGTFNIAADAAINQDLTAGRVALPADHVRINGIRGGRAGMTTEQLYWLLIEHAQTEPDPAAGGGGGESPAGADCGSGATPGRRSWELPEDGDNAGDDAGARDGIGADQAAMIRRQVAQEIRDYQRTAGQDTLPAGLLRWAKEILQPRVDWRAELKRLLRREIAAVTGMRDYTYSRPSRRSAGASGIVLPALRQPRPPEIVAVIDTSGSMSATMLGQCLGEIDAIISRLGSGHGGARPTIRAVAVDVETGVVQTVRSARTISLVGGGGTDLRAGIESAAAGRPKPDLVIVLTDGDTPWADAPPKANRSARYVAVLVNGPRERVPDWLQLIVVDEAPPATG